MATSTITLPSGATVVLRDPATLKVKDRTRVFAAADGKEGILQALSLTDGIIACMVESWSFDLIPPSINIESLGELSMQDYDALSAKAQVAQSVLFPTLAKTVENEADPKATTENSSDSKI